MNHDSPVRILMLEDSALDAELTVAALRRGRLNFEVERVDSREAFSKALQSQPVDLILSDYVLPAYDGMAALALAVEIQPRTPFIFVSGAIGEEMATESLKKGATDYVLKQRIHRLPGAVARALAEARERRQREAVEEALRGSEARYRTLIESIGDYAIFLLDTEGTVTTWNAGAERVLGYAESEIIGRSSSIIFTPEDLAEGAFEKEMREAAANGRAEDERVHVRKDGSRFQASGVLSPVRNNGSMLGYAKVLRDVTERRRMEEELRQSNYELEQFAYAASHDMQEPLRTVHSYAQLLTRRYRGRLDPDAEEFLGYIESGIRHMQLLLDDLLSYSHLLHEHHQRLRTTSMESVLEQVLFMMDATLKESGAEVTHDPLPEVEGDESQLAQVLQNLISNAIKYQEPGNRPKIHLSAQADDGSEIFSVSDNGIGFESEYAERIFGLFRRLHRTRYPGTGIGLALCRRIIERHGGRIWAESTPGKGSTFHFSLNKP